MGRETHLGIKGRKPYRALKDLIAEKTEKGFVVDRGQVIPKRYLELSEAALQWELAWLLPQKTAFLGNERKKWLMQRIEEYALERIIDPTMEKQDGLWPYHKW